MQGACFALVEIRDTVEECVSRVKSCGCSASGVLIKRGQLLVQDLQELNPLAMQPAKLQNLLGVLPVGGDVGQTCYSPT